MKRVMTGGAAGRAAVRSGPAVKALSDGRLEVTFRFQGAPGQRVAVAGGFNDWSPDANPMTDTGSGWFELTLPLPPGRFAYKFVVGGSDWRPDPSNDAREPDGHGGQNSILDLTER